MTKYVALYCRLSPRPDGSYEGVDLQQRWGRDYAASTWPGVPIEVFADEGISAANGDHRPRFEALREALGRGEVAQLWTVEQSRLERTEVGWFRLAAELDAAGVGELHTNRDGIVRVLDEVSGIKAVLASAEVRKLKRRVNDRLDELAADGRPGGAQQFGYRRALDSEGRKTLVIYEPEAAVIREAAEKILAGWSLTRIANDFAGRGLTGARGGRFTGQTIRSFLTAPAVAGMRVHRGQIRTRGVWPPIIDEGIWNAVRDRLAAPRVVERSDGGTYPVRKTARSSTGRKYLLTGGVAVCGVCGAALRCSVKKLRPGRELPYYLCTPNTGGRGCIGVMGPQLEEFVKDELLAELDKPEFLQMLAADEHEAHRDELSQELRAVEGKRRKLARAWAADGLTDEEWQAARDDLNAREKQLRVDLAAVPPPVSNIDPKLIREGWDSMNIDERREIVGLFIEQVVVKRAVLGRRGFDDGRVDIVWRTR